MNDEGTGAADDTTVTVGIVDDDVVLCESLRDLIEATPGFAVIGTATTLSEAFILHARRPHVLLLDLGLPDGSGLELLARTREGPSDTKIVVITVFADVRSVVAAIEDGADGYLLKDAGPAEVTKAIRTVLDGGAPLSPAVASHILGRLRGGARTAPQRFALTPREVQVLEALAAGRSFKDVAAQHGISLHTVGDHVKAIYRKLSVNSRGEAVYKAAQNGLIDLGGQ